MKAIERAVAHFEDQDVKVTIVDEWKDENGKPLKIYSKPLTLAETSKLYKMSQQDDLKMMAMVLVYKALNESGEKMFDLEDKNTLLNKVEQEVLVRVATLMMGQDTSEKAKKN